MYNIHNATRYTRRAQHAGIVLAHLGQIDEIDHDLDHLEPNLPV